ncbi:ParB-like protein [Paraburkholderia tropica]|uniref:ParB-like protein n=1 Tax=Paraburkholderia tropica TaxID=92647 RepID=UPI003C6DEDDF
MALSLLRPTQITAGFGYVRTKALVTARNRTRLAEVVIEHPVKVAIGPDNGSYLLEHRHWALACGLLCNGGVPQHTR